MISQNATRLSIAGLAAILLAGCQSDLVGPEIVTIPASQTANGLAAGADLQVSGSASTGSPNPGATYSYTFQVKNSGPETATGITFSDTLPAGTTVKSASVNGAISSCSSQSLAVSCSLGSLANGTQSVVVVSLTAPTTAGTYVNIGRVTSTVADPQPANNSATVTVQVKSSTTTTSSVVTYSNLGAVPPLADGNGYAIVGQQVTGFFSYIGDQFTATASGAMSAISLPIHQYDTGGNGGFVVQIFTDNAIVPNTLGDLIGSYQGQSIRTTDTSTGLTTVPISNGARLVAGQVYWIKIQPTSQSRETWGVNQTGAFGTHLYADPYQTLYASDYQAAFAIRVIP